MLHHGTGAHLLRDRRSLVRPEVVKGGSRRGVAGVDTGGSHGASAGGGEERLLVLEVLLGDGGSGVEGAGEGKGVVGAGVHGDGGGELLLLGVVREELIAVLAFHGRVLVHGPVAGALLRHGSAASLVVRGAAVGMLRVVALWFAANASGEADFVHEALVALGRGSFEIGEDGADGLDDIRAEGLVEEGSCEDFEDERCAAGLVAENVREGFVAGREEEGLEDGVAGFGFVALIDDFEDGQVGDFVSAEVHQMRDKAWSEDGASLREGAGV